MTLQNGLELPNGRIKKCNFSDPNVNEVFRKCIVVPKRAYKTVVYVSDLLFLIDIRGFANEMLFSVNIQDWVCGIQNRMNVQAGKIGNVSVDDRLAAWLNVQSNKQLILSLMQHLEDRLIVYKNAVLLYTRSLNDAGSRIGMVEKLVDGLNVAKEEGQLADSVIEQLPLNLEPLFPFLKKWSVSDDTERDLLIDETVLAEQRALLAVSMPLMDAVLEYLSAFNEPLPEHATLLANFVPSVLDVDAKLNR